MFWKKKVESVEEVKEQSIVERLFEVIGHSECPYCGHGPMIKYEPAQFKIQCFTCFRITDKADVYIDRSILLAPESRWIYDRLAAKKDESGKPLRPMSDEQYNEMFRERRKKAGLGEPVRVG